MSIRLIAKRCPALAVAFAFALLISALATATLQAQEENTAAQAEMMVDSLPEMPIGITSFGGALCQDHIYVWGGHDGAAHEYYRSGQNATLYRLNIVDGKEWEKVHEDEQGRQGLAMVSYDGNLYRLGGFQARNKRGDDQDLHSVSTFDMFDPESGEWTELSPMPEPRSSFDAVVHGDKLYVMGGWSMQGSENSKWSETAWSIDLSSMKPEWQELPAPPFTRRALSVSFSGDNLYAIGGMQKTGGPTRRVDVFNTKTNEWTVGPELPGEQGMEGFGNSSFNIGGRLCVTTYGGHVYSLSDAGDEWNKMGTLETGRFFHRLLPIADDKFALFGGANMESGKTTDVEVITIK